MKNVKLTKLTQNMQKNTPVIRDKMNLIFYYFCSELF